MKSPIRKHLYCLHQVSRFSGLLFILFFFIAKPSQAQTGNLQWVKTFSKTGPFASGYALPYDLKIDNAGNVINTGIFTDTYDFDPGAGTFNLDFANGQGYIAKLTASGDFSWTKQIGGNAYTITPYSVAVDNSRNILVAGAFSPSGGTVNFEVDFDPSPTAVANLAGGGLFILKLDPDGNFVWAKRLNLRSFTYETIQVATDASGNIFATGGFGSTVDFDPGVGEFNVTPTSGNTIYVLKLDANGNFAWVKTTTCSCTSLPDTSTLGITIDGAGNILTAGHFSNTVDFDPSAGTTTLTAVGLDDAFVWKLNSNGEFVWVKKVGFAGADRAENISTDNAGNIYVSGTNQFINGGGITPFIQKFGTDGTSIWVNNFSSYFTFTASTADANGRVYVTGKTMGQGDINPDPDASLFLQSPSFIARFTTSGSFEWAITNVQTFFGSGGGYSYLIEADANENFYAAGSFNGQVDFDPSAGELRVGSNSTLGDPFIQKITVTIPTPSITSFTPSSGPVGTTVTITGTNFSTTPANNIVKFNGTTAVATTSTATSITTTVPTGASTGLITVTVGQNTATSATNFTVTPVPSITSFTPTSGPVGTTVTITGTNFSTTPANNIVKFNGTTAVATASTATSITTTVPTGATSGLITVKIGQFTATSATPFNVANPFFTPTPGLAWAKAQGGSSGKFNEGIALDASGNVYTVGYFSGTVDFDPGQGTFNETADGGNDFFVSKLNASGEHVWTRTFGRFGSNSYAYCVAIDKDDNIVVGGRLGSYFIDLNPGSGTFTVNNINDAGFILKLSPEGNFIWADGLGTYSLAQDGLGNNYPVDLTIDASNNILATGSFSSSVDFNPGAGTFILNPSSLDIFVLKLAPNGDFVWVRNMGANSGQNRGRGITTDAATDIVITGWYTKADFDPGLGTANLSIAPSDFYFDAFILKLTSGGDFVWVKSVGGFGRDAGQVVTTDAANNITVQGTFTGVADFNPGSGMFSLTAAGFSNYPDTFVLRLNAAGDFVWAKRFGDDGDDYEDYAVSDANGNVYVSGGASLLEDVNPGVESFFLPSKGGFLTKLNTSGDFQWAISNWASLNSDTRGGRVGGLVASNEGTVFLAGGFSGSSSGGSGVADFDPSNCVYALTTVSSSFREDIFIQKLELGAPLNCLTITNFSPPSGSLGTEVVIAGTNFSTTSANNIVRFNGTTAVVTASTATSITTTVPTGATTGLITVSVGQNTATSATNFTVTVPPPVPSITSFTPTSGPVGTTVTINGTNFSTTNENNIVRFNGTTAVATASTATSITTTVPTGATTGLITVSVGQNTATSATNFTVTVPPPVPSITSFTPTSGPVGTTVTINGTNFSTTPANNIVRFNGTTAVATTSTATSITTTVPTGATTGLITISVGEFTATSATNFTVTIITLSITQQPIDLTVCEGQLATFTTQATGANNIAYRWQYSQNGNAPFVDISNGNGYSNATTATLSINTTGNFGAGRYRCVISGEFAQPVTTEEKGLVVTPPSAAPTAANVSRCGNGTVNLIASGGVNGQYRWYTAATGQTAIAGDVNSSYTTPSLSATTTYYVTLTSNGCESVRVPVVATVTVAAAPTTTGASGCLGSAIVLTASGITNGQYRWYTAAAGGAALQGETNSTFTLSSISATTTFYVSVTTANCESTRTPVTATLLTAGCSPVIATQPLVTQVEGIVTLNLLSLITTRGTLDVASLKIITQPRSGATASITNGMLTIDYSNRKSFSGSDEVVIEACNTNGLCSRQSFSIEVAGEVIAYNAVSPNGDDKNEYFKLQYIEAVSPKNRVTIFNRWGDEVFFVDDYDNANRVFSGRTSDGALLPPGTYFYKIALHDTGKLITGFLALRY